MESGSAGSTTGKKQKANEGEDIISNLPESVISCILSCLPTRDAVRTCVLSKRWIHWWKSITKVNINDSMFFSPNERKIDREQYFYNFVHMVLFFTKDSRMESFSLVMYKSMYDLYLDSWIFSVLNRRVKKICIHTSPLFDPVDIPSISLFNHVYLEELDLSFYSHIGVPTSYVCFEHLKLLKLSEVVFINECSSGDCISLNLPVLKEFKAVGCRWLNTKVVNVIAPLLESVWLGQDDFISSFSPRLDISEISCPIKFSDCRMKEFTYWGYGLLEPFILSNTSSAHNASVTMYVDHEHDEDVQEPGFNAFMVLNQFGQVKCIRFHTSEVLTQQDVDFLPVFEMLSYLELSFDAGKGLLGLLQKSPVLKTLVFTGISKFGPGLLNSPVVPDCLASALKIVKFKNVNGFEHELDLANYFMENGIVLERMSFYLAAGMQGKSKVMEEFKENILSFKKGSSFAIVEFLCD